MTSTELIAAGKAGDQVARHAAHFIFTSADDVKSSLFHVTDRAALPVLRLALDVCETDGDKTKAKHLRSKIKQLERAKS